MANESNAFGEMITEMCDRTTDAHDAIQALSERVARLEGAADARATDHSDALRASLHEARATNSELKTLNKELAHLRRRVR